MAWIHAKLYDWFMTKPEAHCLRAWRADLLGALQGDVLELGAGTGLNLPHYPESVERLVLTEPDRHMRRRLERRVADEPGRAASVEVVQASAESLAQPDASFDYVVSTLVLCSVGSVEPALAEAHRVLKPGGALVFLEHVAAEDRPRRLRWQRRIEPLWKRLMGNCHLTRRAAEAIEAAGFVLEGCQRDSMRKAAPWVRPTVRGKARKPTSLRD